ncbi:MAG: tRNA pseudouridine(55) synthase TruB [Desulfatiglandaceae bacterium]
MNRGCSGGILLVDKEEGLSSHQVVSLVKRALGGRKAPKVGHAGTLDPFATGLLVVMVGQATKLSRYLAAEDKIYRAVMKLGEATDTLDATGRVIRSLEGPLPSMEEIEAVSKKFIGIIEQTPPMYSAVKHQGVRAYRLARKGIHVLLKKRNVNISEIELIEYKPPYAKMEIHCSAGTYIRTLAADLGEAMGNAAHLTALRRLSVGSYNIADALGSSELHVGAGCREKLVARLIDPVEVLEWMPSIPISAGLAARISRGYQPTKDEIDAGADSVPREQSGLVKIVAAGRLVAVGRLGNAEGAEKSGFTAERVFSADDD